MKYVLDTNTVAALMKGKTTAVERLLAEERGQVGLPQPVIAEISYGLQRLPKSRARTRLEGLWSLLSAELKHLPWTDEVSHQFGAIKASLERSGLIIEDFDIAIAAHALALGAVLVTANTRHMKRIKGLKLQDWTG